MSDALGNIPALKSLGSLADLRPVVIVDTREQDPLPICRLPSERGTLQSGDYSFRGGEELLAVERKSVPDLVACCVGENRERFFRELHRLRGFRFKRLLIVGRIEEIAAGEYRSNVSPKAVLSTLSVIETRYDVAVSFAPTPAIAAEQVERWVWWSAREVVVAANDLLRGSRESGAAGT